METSFNIGVLVLKRIQKTDGMHKLSAPWEGPFIITEVVSPSTYRLQWGDGQRVPNPWNVEHLRRFYQWISFFSSYVFSPFVFLFFRLNKKYFKQSSGRSRALPPPSSYYKPPLDMLGGLAKANIYVARPGGSKSSLFLPLDIVGGLAKSQPKGHST
jgi:hypothetical protein